MATFNNKKMLKAVTFKKSKVVLKNYFVYNLIPHNHGHKSNGFFGKLKPQMILCTYYLIPRNVHSLLKQPTHHKCVNQ